MKDLIRKVVVILFLMLIIINNSLLIIISNAIGEIQNFIDKSKIKAVSEINIEKYVNYALPDEGKALMIQANLKTGIKYEDNQEYKPLISTQLDLNLPQIGDEYPESVEVIGISTKATNGGDIAKNFNYEYDKKIGKLKIEVANNENGSIYTDNIENARDEYTIISYYSEACYDNKKVERKLEFNGEIQEILADENETIITSKIEQEYIVNENISGLVSTKVETSDIYNGFINSNNLNSASYKTEYIENVKLDIGYREIADEIYITSNDKFINNNKVVDTEEIIYKSTKINKQEVQDELGEDGYLKILDINGNVLGEINKETETLEDGTVEFVYNSEVTQLIINLSKPLNLGLLNIQNTKQIKETMKNIENNKILTTYDIEAINNVQKVDEETGEVIETNKVQIYNFSNDSIVEIKDSETRVDISLDKTEFTNDIQNDVVFTATLFANDSKYNLFKNPVIEIKLPSEVEKVVLGNVSLIHEIGLVKNNCEVIDKDGCKVIRIELSGTQNEYFINSMIEGTTVLIPATIILQKEMDAKVSNISIAYNNETGLKNKEVIKNIEIQMYSISNNQQIQTFSLEDENEVNQVQPQSDNLADKLKVEVQAKVGNKVLNDGEIVYERQVIKYVVKATNTSDKSIANINITGQVPEGTVYGTVNIGTFLVENYEYVKDETVKSYTLPITDLGAGETKTEFYEVVIENLLDTESEKNISNTFLTSVNGVEYNKKTINNVIKKAKVEVKLVSYIGREYKNQFYYFLNVTNLTDNVLTNVEVETDEFQKEMTLTKSKYFDDVSDDDIGIFEDNKFSATIDSIEPKKTRTIEIRIDVGNFDDNVNECLLSMVANVKLDENTNYISNENRRIAYPEYVTVTQTLDKEGENVTGGSQVEYKISIKNESKIKTTVNITDTFSEELENVIAKYEVYDILIEDEFAGYEYDTQYDIEAEANLKYNVINQEINISGVEDKNTLNFSVTIPAGKTLEISVTGTTEEVFETTEVSNYLTVSGNYVKTVNSNTVKFNIVPTEKEEDDDDENWDNEDMDDNEEIPGEGDNDKPGNDSDNKEEDDDKNLKNINGIVWLDDNKDGKRQTDEKLLKNIVVKLYNSDTSSIVVDKSNNKQIKYTNENGEYEFSDVEKGNYLVLFEFDTEKYKITNYQVSGVSEELNSDVTSKEVSIDGNIKQVGVTDILKLDDGDLNNIDMGLIQNKKLDLSLKKYISKVTVKNDEEKVYEYNDAKLAKIEVASKQINNTNIEIEYRIVVNNEGEEDAYVNEIIDYLPQELDFSAILNKNWIKNSEGNLINSSLSGKKIQPGESREVKLILTKELNSNNIGTFVNAAEIGLTKNDEGLSDIDSIDSNRDKNEDDYSEAELIISIKTGIVRNILICLVLIILAVISIIIFCKYKNMRMFSIIIVSVIIVSMASYVKSVNISGSGSPFVGDDGRIYYCVDPGYSQCSSGHHEYSLFQESQSVLVSSYSTDKAGNAKITIVNKGTIDDTVTNEIRIEGYEFSTNQPFNSYEILVEYVMGEKKKTQDVTIKKEEIVPNEEGKFNRGKFNIRVPNGAENIKVEIEVTYNNAIETSNTYQVTEIYRCTAVSGTHSSQSGCRPLDKVQKVRTTNNKTSVTATDKTISSTISKNVEYGDVKIIKLDSVSKKLLGDDDKNEGVKFRVYYKDEKNKKHYIKDNRKNKTSQLIMKEGQGSFVKDKESAILEMGENGYYIIKGLQLGYDYYFEEVEAPDLYQKLDEDEEISVSDKDVTDVKAIKRATQYIFTRPSVKKALLKKSDENENEKLSKDEKNTYTSFIYNYIKGNKLTKKVDDEVLKKLRSFIGENPTDSEIKGLVNYIIDDKATEKQLNNIMNDKLEYVKKILTVDGFESVLYDFQVSKAKGLLDKQTVNLIYNNPNKGALEIIKYDADNRECGLEGAKFSVKNKYNSNDSRYYENNNVVTDKDGKILLENVPVGEYIITEIGAPSEYNLSLQTEKEKTVKVIEGNTSDKPVVVEFVNKKYADLQVEKIDEDTQSEIKKSGVKFKVYVMKNNTKNYIKTYTQGNPSSLTYTTDASLAKVLVTGEDGKTEILKNIPMNQTYYVEECELPTELMHYYEVNTTPVLVTLQSNVVATTVVKVVNKQRYVDVSGYVWEDIVSEKNSTRNYLYKDNENDSNDKLVQGITVRLKNTDKDTPIAETITDENGAYKFEGKVLNPDGTVNAQIEIEQVKLNKYYIEFEYNGLKYSNVLSNINIDNGSKAIEKTQDRNNFNLSYSTISGGNIKEGSTKGYSLNQNGEVTNELTYKNGQYTSLLVSETGYTVDSAKDYISAKNGSNGVTMKADTSTAGYVMKWDAGMYEIKNINLGIAERAQPDMAIAADLESVELKFGDYSHSYLYDKRRKLYDYNENGDIVGVDVFSELTKYVEENENYPKEYTRGIYKNYIYASGVNGEAKLEFYSTYKITVKNKSSLYVTADEITNYYKDTDSSIVESWYVDSNGNKIDVSWTSEDGINEYAKITTESLRNIKIEPKGSIDIYLKMKKSDEKIAEWSLKDEGCVEETYNVSEIASYSTYTKNGNDYIAYAGIDKNSAPDNIEPGKVDTYEDDTDAAPVLKIMLDEPRTISGYVFEDNTPEELNTNGERKGDSKYNANEDGYVGNVEVKLIKENGDTAKIYPYSKNNNINYENAEIMTNEENSGRYDFIGVIPGKYYLQFTYSDGSVIYKQVNEKEDVSIQNYKSTIIDEKVREKWSSGLQQWYKENAEGYSVAYDNYDIRQDLNNKISTINYSNKTNYSKEEHSMVATTENIEIAIENVNNETTEEENNRQQIFENLNFGIVERPRQQLDVDKTINYIKLELANGQILCEGNPKTNTDMPYVTYLEEAGILKMEVDSEIVQGAELEVTFDIKVKNNSELDYDTKEYYLYGIIGNVAPVKTTINAIADYMDETLKTVYEYNQENGSWHIAEKDLNKVADIEISPDLYKQIKNNDNVLVMNNNIELGPGEESAIGQIKEVKASKLLSTSGDTTYKNNVELLQVSNSVGRFYGEKDSTRKITKWKLITPGNLDISIGPQEIDEAIARVAIVPPTGQTRIYYVLGINCLVILLGGIIFIKKKVLD